MLCMFLLSCIQQEKEIKATKRNIPSEPAVVVWNDDSLTIGNGSVMRKINFSPSGEISSVSYRLVAGKSGIEFIAPRSHEFSIVVNDKLYTGLNSWKVAGIEKTDDSTGGSGASVRLLPLNSGSAFEVKLTYLLYPGLPAVRKQLTVINTGNDPLKVEEIDVEALRLARMVPHNSWIYRQYARYKHLGPYVGDCNDPLIIVHHQDSRRGIAIGNEAIGVIKRTACFEDGRSITAGFTHRNQEFPFRKWVEKGQQFTTPFVFTLLYDGHDDPSWALNVTVPDLVRRHLGIRVNELKKKPMFVYNTWYPFYHNINDSLVYSLIKAAAECGAEEFIIDDGWQTNLNAKSEKDRLLYGDWAINERKFPDGLRPVFDSVKMMGMRPGMWISLAAAQPGSEPFTAHPEWFVRDAKGRLTNLHEEINYGMNLETQPYTACMGTDWKDYIKEKILFCVKEYGLAYAKLDFAVVCSAYQFNQELTGCHATDHPYHKDREESYYILYQRVMELFDELHAEAPDLFIDCTFETAGKLQLMDYGIARYAEGNWLSNVQHPTPLGPLRVRNLAWGRTPALPATSLVIGNLALDHPLRLFCFQSLAGTLPIMLGDPRQLKPAERKEMKDWSDWLRSVEQRHGYSEYRQDLPGYGEPAEGFWDGFARINTETQSGGLVGIFRQGTAEKSRTITLPYLNASTLYAIRQAPNGKVVAKMTGADLEQKGFQVTLKEPYQGMLYEIVMN